MPLEVVIRRREIDKRKEQVYEPGNRVYQHQVQDTNGCDYQAEKPAE